MKLEVTDQNYCATVIRAPKLVKLENADRLLGLPLFGLQAIVGLNTAAGDLGILLPAECQLSDDFCRSNNLYRHPEKNADGVTVGYIEDNRRVRAIKLRGNRSDALFLPLSGVIFRAGTDAVHDFALKEGDQFNSIDGYEVCKKYVRKQRQFVSQPKKLKEPPRVDERLFPQHFDSQHYARVDRNIPQDAHVIVTQKLHGTSIRVGYVPVKRKLSLLERLAQKLGVKVLKYEYDHVYGSRKVIKDAENPNQQHFYDHDLWTDEGKKLKGLLPEGYVIYAEIIGWTDGGSPIQSNYTYDCPPATRKMYVYRITHVNRQGTAADLSWEAVKQFCQQAGLLHVPELWRGKHSEFIAGGGPDFFLDKTFHLRGGNGSPLAWPWDNAVPISSTSPCDEGICIRVEGIIPEIVKAKSPLFLQHETKMLDKDDSADLEADEEAFAIAARELADVL